MTKHHTVFRTTDGDVFPPLFVNAKIAKGSLYTYFRKGGSFKKGGLKPASIPGVRMIRPPVFDGKALVAPGVVALTRDWWDGYNALRHGRPMPDAPTPQPTEKGRVIPKSVDALIAHYCENNDEWIAKSEKTRGKDRLIHRYISRNIGEFPVKDIELDHLRILINSKVKEGKRAAAKQLRTVLGMLFDHARLALKWRPDNPVRDIKKPVRLNKDGLHTLTEPEVEALRQAHPDYASDERYLLEMGVHYGPRAGDLCNLGWRNIVDGRLVFTPEKTENSTGAQVSLPIKGEHVLAVLAHRPKDAPFFLSAPPRGVNLRWAIANVVSLKPWDYTRARKTWKAMREKAGIGDRSTLHSLRKYMATRMADAGANPQDIADALGDTLESALIYTRKRNKVAGGDRAFHAAIAA